MKRAFSSAAEFRKEATSRTLMAAPMPGTNNTGPWLKGTLEDHAVWQQLFAEGDRPYRARKGITTDRNGIYFVRVSENRGTPNTCRVENDPAAFRTRGIPVIRKIIEKDHVFPLLRGRGVTAFAALPDRDYHVIVPQRGMHGDPDLPTNARMTFEFFYRFRAELARRSSYRRFQRNQPYWSTWSTGPYTFKRWKVLWREMAGGKFAAAFVGKTKDPILGSKVLIPDHKLYFVPVRSKWTFAVFVSISSADSEGVYEHGDDFAGNAS